MAAFSMVGVDANGRQRFFAGGDEISSGDGNLWTLNKQYYWDNGTLTTHTTPSIFWAGRTTISGGTATFYVTDNGAVDGNAIFSDLASTVINVTPISPSTADDEVPFAAISNVTATSVTVVAKRGTTISLLGVNSLRNAANGTVIFLTVFGAA